ncbi:MAG: type II toxin-antitoxin system RelE/ParE family toxin [Gammaproteobacteria bacterium]|nr:type II toxin-antitoxin system RelE/ParE family toxin [Gammaproteobacteria bacterium]
MDYRVSWSPTALDDVDAIAEYINRDSPAYSRAVVNKLVSTARELSDSPNAGRIVPALADEAIRERFVYSYRLINEKSFERKGWPSAGADDPQSIFLSRKMARASNATEL